MTRVLWIPTLGLFSLLAAAGSAWGQNTAYIGFVYPAGGQQGTTARVKLGGQRLDGTHGAVVTGEGVTAKLVEFYGRINNQEMTLLREQLRELSRDAAQKAKAKAKNQGGERGKDRDKDKLKQEIITRIEKRMANYCNRPACAALSEIAYVEVTIAADAEPGRREIRLVTDRGVTNPMAFYVGQIPEVARKPMKTSDTQVLGKEAMALRNRPDDEVQVEVTVPCTMNGQIASGEVNRYRFEAHKGQRLVVSVNARDLVPYIADAVPGWFQPVIALYDADGREVAFNDDFRFKPDPTLYFEVPEDGEYVLEITDAIYRGREDFVYRLSVGEVPFLTSVFPLGRRAGETGDVEMDGWNLDGGKLATPPADAAPGTYLLTAKKGRLVSNAVPFAVDTLPECLDQEPNNDAGHAQKVELPTIVNGRIDRQDDWDVFRVEGRAGEKLVAEVHARRLDSPLDSMLKVTDESGRPLAMNDDHCDPGCGLNTHHADSYLMVELPADGAYYVHIGDAARAGGRDYGYRLRIGSPRPDFELRATPSGGGIRSNGYGPATVYVIRKDGFDADIQLSLKDPPKGFSAATVTLPKDKESVRFGVKTTLAKTDEPVSLRIEGRATIAGQEVAHEAVPAEDRMQAFLWRHLVPAEELTLVVYDPSDESAAKRVPPPAPPKSEIKKPTAALQFTKRQVTGRLRQLKLLYEQWLLTDEFYLEKVAECEAVE